MTNPTISVALCTFNGALYVEAQIESLLNQTLKPTEIVICDDGSSDGTLEVLNRLRHKHPEIRLSVNPSQLGVVKNFEHAISLCKSEWIALCDQDDVWDRTKLAVQMQATQKVTGPALIFSDLEVVEKNLRPLAHSFWERSGYKLRRTQTELRNQLIVQNFVTGCTCLVNRSLVKVALPFPPGIPMHDHWLALVAATWGQLIPVFSQTIKYRQHGNNAVGSKQQTSLQFLLSLVKNWKKELQLAKKNYQQKIKMFDYVLQLNPTKAGQILPVPIEVLAKGSLRAGLACWSLGILPQPRVKSLVFLILFFI